jgi:hypothetical protein
VKTGQNDSKLVDKVFFPMDKEETI